MWSWLLQWSNQNRGQKIFSREALRVCRGAWHSNIWQKLYWVSYFQFGGLKPCLGVWYHQPPPLADGTGSNLLQMSHYVACGLITATYTLDKLRRCYEATWWITKTEIFKFCQNNNPRNKQVKLFKIPQWQNRFVYEMTVTVLHQTSF